jgi:hypothetical protein
MVAATRKRLDKAENFVMREGDCLFAVSGRLVHEIAIGHLGDPKRRRLIHVSVAPSSIDQVNLSMPDAEAPLKEAGAGRTRQPKKFAVLF